MNTILKRKFRLRTTLVLPFVLQIVTAVGLVGYLSFRNGQRSVDRLANQLIEETGTRIEQHVLDYFRQPQTIVQMTHAGLQSGNLDLNDIDGLRRYFWHVVSKEKLDNYLYLGTKKGEFVGVERMDNDTIRFKVRTLSSAPNRKTYLLDAQGNPQKLLKARAYDPRERPWYREGIKIRQSGWSPVFASFSRKNSSLEISPIGPVFNSDGQVLAVVSMNLRLVHITDFLQDLYISPQGQSFIMERSGDLIASSAPIEPFTIIGAGDEREIERLPATDAQEATVSETARFLQQQFGSLAAIADTRQLKMTIDDALYYIQVLPIRDGRGIDWLTVVVVPEQDFMAQINQNTRNTILLCLLALGIAIASGIFTARLISRHILRVSQASDQLAQGDLDQQVAPSPIIEIDTLADSFNTMAEKLKKSFNTLQQSEERFRGLVANIPGAIYRCQWDSDWTMQYISDAIETISGYPASDFIQNQVRTYVSIIHPDDRDLVEVIISKARMSHKPYIIDYRVLHRDGSIRWVYERGQAVFDADKNPLYLDGAIFDITDRQLAEEALRIAEENYRSIFDNAVEGIFQSSPEGKFITVNPALARIYGYDSPQEMIDSITNISEQLYVDPEQRTKFKKLLATQDTLKDFEYRCYCKDGSIIWTEIDARVVKDNNGNVLCYEGIVQDITERKRREDDLRRQLKELKIEIDREKREKEVAMLTESSYFQEVQQEMAEVDLDEFWSYLQEREFDELRRSMKNCREMEMEKGKEKSLILRA